jgi:hypothetical protein
VYEDTKALRYGHLMIMTDQDHDGSHIKGLIMNFLHHFYPSLLKIPGFLVEFITPIIKVRRTAVSRRLPPPLDPLAAPAPAQHCQQPALAGRVLEAPGSTWRLVPAPHCYRRQHLGPPSPTSPCAPRPGRAAGE